jgi:hypothetical protein
VGTTTGCAAWRGVTFLPCYPAEGAASLARRTRSRHGIQEGGRTDKAAALRERRWGSRDLRSPSLICNRLAGSFMVQCAIDVSP